MASNLPDPGLFVDDELRDEFNTSIRQLISDLGVEIKVFFVPTASGCPNCFSSVDGTSNGVYDSSNPNTIGGPLHKPFGGGTCPVCFPSNTLIDTQEGYKKICDIKIGELVYDIDFKLKEVTQMFNRKSDHLLNIKFDGYNNFLCTKEHPIRILRNNKEIWVEAANLQDGDYFILPLKSFNNKDLDKIYINWQYYCRNKYYSKSYKSTVIKLRDNLGLDFKDIAHILGKERYAISRLYRGLTTTIFDIDDDVVIDDDFLYIIGWYIAEGCVNNGKYKREITYSLNSNEMNVCNKLIRIFKDKFNINYRIEQRKDKPNSLWVHFYNSVLARWLSDWCGECCDNKVIPEVLYKNCSIGQLNRLCKYIIDGDGYKRKSEINLSTTSKKLALQIFSILQSSHELPRLHYNPERIDKNNINHKEWWNIAYFNNRHNKLIKRFIRNNKEYRLFRTYFVINKEYDVYNLEVDISNNYIADCVAVHNCRGSHKILTENSIAFKALREWSPEDIDVTQYGLVPANTVLTKAEICFKQDMERAVKVLIDGDIVVRATNPTPAGLAPPQFVDCLWRKQD